MSNSNRFPQDNSARPNQFANSFDSVSDSKLAGHLQNSRYGEFELTGAVRPALDLKITPTQGYRHEVYVDEETKAKVPVVMAAASRETLFPLFMQLIQKLGPVVDVVLESSHSRDGGEHVDMYREQIDMPVLTSILWDYEDLLLNDGCTGIAVLNPNTPQEIQFEEHKLLIVYGSPLEQFEFVLESNGVTERQNMKLITEAEHVHSSTESFARRFEQLRVDLGLDGNQELESYDTGEEGDAYGSSFDNFNSESYGDSYRDSYGDDPGTGGMC
jgi:hypothetical protein